MSGLEADVWQRYRDQGVLVYGLYGAEDPDLIEDFVEQTGVTYPVIDGRDTQRDFAYPPGSGYPYPRDVVIGKDLTIHSIRNSFNLPELRALVERLLAEP